MAKKKISLREFQESLVQRLTSARAGQTSRALLGVQAGLEEGIEVNILGLVTGVDLRQPALKLPGFGRVPG